MNLMVCMIDKHSHNEFKWFLHLETNCKHVMCLLRQVKRKLFLFAHARSSAAVCLNQGGEIFGP